MCASSLKRAQGVEHAANKVRKTPEARLVMYGRRQVFTSSLHVDAEVVSGETGIRHFSTPVALTLALWLSVARRMDAEPVEAGRC